MTIRDRTPLRSRIEGWLACCSSPTKILLHPDDRKEHETLMQWNPPYRKFIEATKLKVIFLGDRTPKLHKYASEHYKVSKASQFARNITDTEYTKRRFITTKEDL